jgi:hypothetical protein
VGAAGSGVWALTAQAIKARDAAAARRCRRGEKFIRP